MAQRDLPGRISSGRCRPGASTECGVTRRPESSPAADSPGLGRGGRGLQVRGRAPPSHRSSRGPAAPGSGEAPSGPLHRGLVASAGAQESRTSRMPPTSASPPRAHPDGPSRPAPSPVRSSGPAPTAARFAGAALSSAPGGGPRCCSSPWRYRAIRNPRARFHARQHGAARCCSRGEERINRCRRSD